MSGVKGRSLLGSLGRGAALQEVEEEEESEEEGSEEEGSEERGKGEEEEEEEEGEIIEEPFSPMTKSVKRNQKKRSTFPRSNWATLAARLVLLKSHSKKRSPGELLKLAKETKRAVEETRTRKRKCPKFTQTMTPQHIEKIKNALQAVADANPAPDPIW